MDPTAGRRHESARREPLVRRVPEGWPGVSPRRPAGDEGHGCERIGTFLEGRGIEPVIARRKDQRREGDEDDFDEGAYRRRPAIECRIGRLKECRAVATRYEKLATNFLGAIRLALIQRYLRLLDSSDRA